MKKSPNILNIMLTKTHFPMNSIKPLSLTGLTSHLFAHRGIHGTYHQNDKKLPTYIPENTLASFLLAIQQHLAIELDVQLTLDQQVVVFHDNSTKRLTQVSKKIKYSTLSELQSLKILPHSTCLNQPFTEKMLFQIPTLSDTLKLIAGQTPLLIELKSAPIGDFRPLCQKTAQLLQQYKSQNQAAFIAIKSFDPRIVQWFQRFHPDIPAGLLISSHPKSLLALGLLVLHFPLNAFLTPHFISVDKKKVHKKIIQKYRQDHPILCWTLSKNSTKSLKQFADNFIIE